MPLVAHAPPASTDDTAPPITSCPRCGVWGARALALFLLVLVPALVGTDGLLLLAAGAPRLPQVLLGMSTTRLWRVLQARCSCCCLWCSRS